MNLTPWPQRNGRNETAQLIAAALCCFSAGSLYGWSALIPVVEATLTQSTGSAGFIFSLAIVSFTIAVFIAPRLPQAFQQLSGCSVFALTGAVSLSIASLSATYLMFVLFFSVGFGIASGAIYINALLIASASKWPKISTPVMVASFGLGGAVFGPVWRMLAAKGWDMSALLPATVALACSAFLAILFNHSRFAGKSVGNVAESSVDDPPTDNLTPVALICLVFGFGSMAGLMVLGLASKIIDVAGGTVVLSTIAIAGVAIGNTGGRLSVGLITLHYTSIQSVIVACIVIIFGLVLIAAAPVVDINLMLLCGLTIVALGYGMMASSIPVLVRSLCSEVRFAQVFSIVFLAWGVAGLTAPWLAGVMFDRTGSFQPSVIGALVMTILAWLFAIQIRRQS